MSQNTSGSEGKQKKEYTNRGSLLFSRKWLGNNLARHPSAFTIYFHLLGWANHEHGRLRLGEVALGERDFAQRIGMSVTTARKWLRWLRDNDWITLRPIRYGKVRGTVVTVLRYAHSQSFSTYKLPSEDQKMILTPASEDQKLILDSAHEDQKMILTTPIYGSENDPSCTHNSIRDSAADAQSHLPANKSVGGDSDFQTNGELTKRCPNGQDQGMEEEGVRLTADAIKKNLRSIQQTGFPADHPRGEGL